ncbi:MAG: DUF475 domain-containing protein [Candidatus Nitrotoga sp.]|nr:DUF475 domain-containing protein [Candidatus Nitrotoga sp.]MBP0117977.1 DUF475 domain-containing protein [Candidatus Nitrotoga sp.]
MRHFKFSFLIALLGLGLAACWGYSHGGLVTAFESLGVTAILCVMEVSLSFDNAVVNASVLRGWSRFWQDTFLTIGMLIAVFGMRLLFPLMIVALAADINLLEVWRMGLEHSDQYALHLTSHHAEIAAFGGIFLFLVFLNFLLDEKKELHWLGHVEEKIATWGTVGSIPVMVALSTLLASLSMVAEGRQLTVLVAGLWGMLSYIAIDVTSNFLEREQGTSEVGDVIKRGGVSGFIYLEMLDASFSFDGVIGSFAITKDIVIIMIGLGIGAMFVRSMTVFMVRKETLSTYVYLEHGAHYAIGILAVIMLASMKFHIPEVFTGLVGIAFIAAALFSSLRHRRATLKG